MTILFLDQSGELGGAELCLLDILCHSSATGDSLLANAQVALFSDGPFRERLARANIEHHLVGDLLPPRRDRSMLRRRLCETVSLIRSVQGILRLAKDCELLYANTPKAMVVGAIVQRLTGLPLVYHLHDILSEQHFGRWEYRFLIRLARACATRVIVNSQASQKAFVSAGGQPEQTTLIYNGFLPEQFSIDTATTADLKQELGIRSDRFTIGCFSRFAPWKGQSLLLEALAILKDPSIELLLVGDALFGEGDYGLKLRQKTAALGLEGQVQFLGFREDVPQLLSTCDLIVHSPRAPEPFGRVMVEGMLAGKPVIAPQEGSAPELLRHGETGWLIPPRDSQLLAQAIERLQADSSLRLRLGQAAAVDAAKRFHLHHTNHQISELCQPLCHQSAPKLKRMTPPPPFAPP